MCLSSCLQCHQAKHLYFIRLSLWGRAWRAGLLVDQPAVVFHSKLVLRMEPSNCQDHFIVSRWRLERRHKLATGEVFAFRAHRGPALLCSLLDNSFVWGRLLWLNSWIKVVIKAGGEGLCCCVCPWCYWHFFFHFFLSLSLFFIFCQHRTRLCLAIHLVLLTMTLLIKHCYYHTVEVVAAVNAASSDHNPQRHIHVVRISPAFFMSTQDPLIYNKCEARSKSHIWIKCSPLVIK